MYVYIRSEGEQVWTAGFYKPDGGWEPESDWPTPEEAAKRVHYLNGGEGEKTGENEKTDAPTPKALMLKLADVSSNSGCNADDFINVSGKVDEFCEGDVWENGAIRRRYPLGWAIAKMVSQALTEAPVLSWGVVEGVVAECHGELERLQSAIEDSRDE